MKKIISAILVFAMCLSLMGGITVSAATMAKEYHFSYIGGTGTSNTAGGKYGVDKKGVGYAATAGQFHGFLVNGFGNHGWYSYAVDYDENADFHYRMFQLADSGLHIRADYEKGNESVHTSGIQAAFVLDAPAAGYYEVAEGMFTEGNTLYISKATGDETAQSNMTDYKDYKKDLSEYTKNENLIGVSGTITGFSNGEIDCHDLSKVIYSDGDTNLVLTVDVPDGGDTQLRALKLTPASGTPTLELDNTRIMIGQKSKATFKVGEKEAVSSFVTYGVEGENPCVEVDSKTGEITAKSTGTATITATLAEGEVYTATIEVVKDWEYHFSYILGTSDITGGKYGVDKNSNGFTAAANQFHGFLVNGFGNHGWYSYAVDYDEDVVFTHNIFRVLDNHTQIKADGLAKVKAGFALKAPQKGYYIIGENTNTAGNTFYISKADASVTPQIDMTNSANYKKDLDGYATEENLAGDSVANASGFTTSGTISYTDLKRVIYSDGVSDLLLVVDVPGTQDAQLRAVRLEAISGTPEIRLENASLETGDTTTAKLVLMNRSLVNSFVDWTVEGTSVSIDDCGNITANKAGPSTIKATVGGVSYTATVTVTEEDTALNDAFDAVEDKITITSYEVGTVSAVAYTVGTDAPDSNITVDAKDNENGTYTLDAPEYDGYNFLYWKKGVTTKKDVITYKATDFVYAPTAGENNIVIAVYEKVGESTANKAEFYNANGQFITATDGSFPTEIPSMAGYGDAIGWKCYTDGETYELDGSVEPSGIMLFVADYEDTLDTVKVNGTDVPYGTEISFTAAPEEGKVFKCWKRTDKDGNEEIVSIEVNYKFRAYEDCTIEEVDADSAVVLPANTRKIVLDTFKAGTATALMAEFIGFKNDTVVEKGIMFGDNRIAMKSTGTQFTIIPDEIGTYKGYAIIKNADNSFSLITDGSYIK